MPKILHDVEHRSDALPTRDVIAGVGCCCEEAVELVGEEVLVFERGGREDVVDDEGEHAM